MSTENGILSGFQSLERWFKAWLALTIGSFLGYSIVPALFHKARTNSDWGQAIDYGGQVLYERFFPTFLTFSLIAGIIVFIGWKKGKIR